MYYVYCCTCDITNKSYVGVTNNIRRRWIEHRNLNGDLLFQKAVKRYGEGHFHTKILFKTIDRALGFEKEQEFIEKLNTRKPNGYNVTKGGLGHTGCVSLGFKGKKHSKETRKKMSMNHSDQTGENNPMYGRHLSTERKKQISEFMRGNKYSLGKKLTEEHKQKIRIAQIGRKHSEESKKKMSLVRKRYWDRKRGVTSATKSARPQATLTCSRG